MDPSYSLERIYPEMLAAGHASDRKVLDLHLARYQFAVQNLQGGRVLDMACGCGYGTALLAEKRPDIQFVGVDVDADAVAYGTSHYKASNLEYRQSDGMTFQDPDGFDMIVSLETIEHLVDPRGFVNRFSGLLKPGGRVVASVPVTPTVDGNPHHLHDFTRRSFRRMMAEAGFSQGEAFTQVQKWEMGGLFAPKKNGETTRTRDAGGNVVNYYLRKPWALGSRIWSICRYGLANHYLTAVFSPISDSATKPRDP